MINENDEINQSYFSLLISFLTYGRCQFLLRRLHTDSKSVVTEMEETSSDIELNCIYVK